MEHFIQTAGYAAIFVLMTAESACIPVPSEVTMLFGGALAAEGKLGLVGVILAGTAGNIVGSYLAWAVGRVGGRPAVEKVGRFVLVAPSDLDRAERWFGRRGEAAVLVSRVLPVVRTFISLPAGIARMEPLRFGLFTALGSAVWMTALSIAGYEVGPSWRSVSKDFSGATYVIAGLALLMIVAALVHQYRKVRREAVEPRETQEAREARETRETQETGPVA